MAVEDRIIEMRRDLSEFEVPDDTICKAPVALHFFYVQQCGIHLRGNLARAFEDACSQCGVSHSDMTRYCVEYAINKYFYNFIPDKSEGICNKQWKKSDIDDLIFNVRMNSEQMHYLKLAEKKLFPDAVSQKKNKVPDVIALCIADALMYFDEKPRERS